MSEVSQFLTLVMARKRVNQLMGVRVESIYEEMDQHTMRGEKVSHLLATAVHQAESIEQDVSWFKAKLYLTKRQLIPRPTEEEIRSMQEVEEGIRSLKQTLAHAIAVRKYMESVDRKFDGRGMMLTQMRKLIEAESK